MTLSPVSLLLAQQTPNASPGFRAEGVYDLGDVDEVSLFNGGLTISIPLTPAIPVGGSNGLVRGLALTYSNSAWEATPYSCYPDPQPCGAEMRPKPTSNAGLGWRVSLGALYKPQSRTAIGYFPKWQYVDASGTEHTLYPTLHPLDAQDAGDPVPALDFEGTMYTRSGSYLRVRCANPSTFGLCTVEFPDGQQHIFTNFGTSSDPEYRITKMQDRSSNEINIAYNAGNTLWTITSTGSTSATRVGFTSVTGFPGQTRLVDYVEIPCVGGSCPGGGTHARWDFSYANASGIWPPQVGGFNPQQTAKVLTSLSRPDGRSFSMPVARYSVNAGVLERLDLPTGGRVEWTWSHFQFPEILADRWPCPQELPPDQYFWTGVHGVSERRTYDTGGSMLGEWTYGRESFPPEGTPGVLAEKLVVSVRSPLNDLTEHFFSIFPLEGGAPYCPWEGPPQWETSLKEYGLPYTRETSLRDTYVADGIQRFLSRRSYDCPTSGTSGCVLKRSTYVAYDQDAGSSSSWEGGELLDRHRRPFSERTVFHDDGDRWNLRTSSDYDGAGHYRTTVTQGNFPSNAPVRTATTRFNPGLTFPMAPGTPWILGTFDRTDVSEAGGATLRKEFGFQASTGLLSCVRTLRSGTSPTATDLLTKYTYQAGNLATESHYGGDLQPIGTGAGCGAQGTSVPITIQHEWDHGVRARSWYSGAPGYLLDLDIDAATGLPTASRDSALVRTDFSYDKLGRTTRIDPQAPPGGGLRDGVTQIVYPAGTPAEVIVRRCDPGVASCIASVAKSIEEVRFDGLGRVIREKRTRPNAAGGAAKWSKRVTGWDGAGHRTSVSSWVDEAATNPPKTTFQDYDPFGRPGRITAPDASETKFTYQGVRLTTTEQKIDLSQGGDAQTAVERRETFDHRGRRITVEEYSNPAAPSTYVQTTYRYDAGDRLDRVRVDSGGTNQDRLFTYDGRGFLLSEQHPEKGGLNGHGTVEYGSYDARGKAGFRRDVGASGVPNREVRFVYDGEERLYRVRDGSNVLWKEFSYYTGNTAGASLGKLKTAWRHNDLDVPTNASYDVTETYEYRGRHGRASKRTTQLRVGGVLEESWFFESDYDPFGSPDWISYPCTGASCAGATPSREIEVTYDQGLMVGIEELGTGADWASLLTWHPNLTLAKVTHGNDLVETITADPNGMARPLRFTWAQGSTSANTGDYKFDGAGNVSRMGSDHFQYDKVSRLVFATLGSLGRTQASAFDRYGSLTSLATDGQPAQAIPVRSATNRLLAGGYDASGNLTSWSGNTYAWSPVDTLTSWTNGSEGSSYVYTADDERLLALHWYNGSQTWTVRDFGNRVLRRDERLPPVALSEVSNLAPCPSGTPSTQVFCDGFETGNAAGWTSSQSGPARTVTDYVWRGDQLLGSQLIGDPWRHYGLDHLGTIRVVSGDIPDGFLAEHTYFPFGREATDLAVSPGEILRSPRFQTPTVRIADLFA